MRLSRRELFAPLHPEVVLLGELRQVRGQDRRPVALGDQVHHGGEERRLRAAQEVGAIAVGDVAVAVDEPGEISHQRIPSYNTIDAGVAAYVGENWEFRLSGSNLGDEIGLTEANPRIIGGAVDGDVFLGRPIFGRAWEFSVAYRF